jgi:hypothetical protein
MPSVCGNNQSCSKEGKLTCTQCNTIKYCSADCQRSHWKLHKNSCKSITRGEKKELSMPNVLPPAPVSQLGDIHSRLNSLKVSIQEAYTASDFSKCLSLTEDALSITGSLSEPFSSIEVCQLLFRMGDVYGKLEKLDAVEKSMRDCTIRAEQHFHRVQDTNLHQQASELLYVSHLRETQTSMSIYNMSKSKNDSITARKKLESAERSAALAQELAHGVRRPEDPLQIQALHLLAIVKSEAGKLKEAEDHYREVHKKLCSSKDPRLVGVQDAVHQDLCKLSQMSPSARLQLAEENFEGVKRKNFPGDDLFVSQCHAQLGLAQFQSQIYEKMKDAEKSFVSALSVCRGNTRESVHFADVLVLLSKLRECLGNFTEHENEAILLQAQKIYSNSSETASRFGFHTTIQEDIDRVRQSRNRGNVQPVKGTSQQPNNREIAQSDKAILAEVSKSINEAEIYVRTGTAPNFLIAIPMLEKAIVIFTRIFGDEHAYTLDVKKRLNNAFELEIAALWDETVQDVVSKASEMFSLNI